MFTVWSPFDGEPIPAPNETERDILLSQGYLAEEPEKALAAGRVSDPSKTQIDLVGESGPELLTQGDLDALDALDQKNRAEVGQTPRTEPLVVRPVVEIIAPPDKP